MSNQFIFVFSKDDEVRCLSFDEEKHGGNVLRSSGWKHTMTIDPRLWINWLVTAEDADALNMINELRTGTRNYNATLNWREYIK